MMLELNKIYNMDCIEGLKQIPSNSIDTVITDPPYGVTACKWDKPLPLDKLWKEYKRISKNDTVIVLTSCQPYTVELIDSNKEWFKYELIWVKNLKTGFINAYKQPMKSHENILIFYNGSGKYNPQKILRSTKPAGNKKSHITEHYGIAYNNKQTNYIFPSDVLEIDCIHGTSKRYHPSQKPLELFEYLIKTYSNENDLVLDNCMGSGTTAVACKGLNRRFIGFEINKEYYDISLKRLLNVPERLEKWIDS